SHFQQPGFHRLYLITKTGRYNRYDRMSHLHHFHFVLTDSDRLDHNDLVSSRLQHHRCVASCPGKPTRVSSGGHAPNIDIGIDCTLLLSDQVTTLGAACHGAADIDSQDPDLHA